MSEMIAALRIHADVMPGNDCDLTDFKCWTDTASKLLLMAADEIHQMRGRDAANVETIKVLASMLAKG